MPLLFPKFRNLAASIEEIALIPKKAVVEYLSAALNGLAEDRRLPSARAWVRLLHMKIKDMRKSLDSSTTGKQDANFIKHQIIYYQSMSDIAESLASKEEIASILRSAITAMNNVE